MCKKESEHLLENIINEIGSTELINNILIDNEKMHSNTFFKRNSDKNDIISSKNEKINLGTLLKENHYSKI